MGSNYTKEEMENIVKNSKTIKECLTKMNRPNGHGNYATFYRYKRIYNLDTSHFNSVSNPNGRCNVYKPLSEYTKDEVCSIKGSVLLKKLIDEGYKEYKCENPECGLSEWHGKPISLQVHHIDGNHYNCSLENLMILCPNCHSQTDSFCGRGRKNKKEKRYCKICKRELGDGDSELCVKCSHLKQRKVEWPQKEELEQLLKNGNFSSVGKMFGVSDNAVRKWCKYYGLSTSAKDYKNGSVA